MGGVENVGWVTTHLGGGGGLSPTLPGKSEASCAATPLVETAVSDHLGLVVGFRPGGVAVLNVAPVFTGAPLAIIESCENAGDCECDEAGGDHEVHSSVSSSAAFACVTPPSRRLRAVNFIRGSANAANNLSAKHECKRDYSEQNEWPKSKKNIHTYNVVAHRLRIN